MNLPRIKFKLVAGAHFYVAPGLAEALVLTAAFNAGTESIIVVKSSLYEAERLYHNLSACLPAEVCSYFPFDEGLGIDALATSPELLYQRIKTLARAVSGVRQVVITTGLGLTAQISTPDLFKQRLFTLEVGATWSREALLAALETSGYRRVEKLEAPLQYACRGDIIDVYSLSNAAPLRIELLFDEIESLRYFELEGQRTTMRVNHATILPAADLFIPSDPTLSKTLAAAFNQEVETAPEALKQEIEYLVAAELARFSDLDPSALRAYLPRLGVQGAYLADYFLTAQRVIVDEITIINHTQTLLEEMHDYRRDLEKLGRALLVPPPPMPLSFSPDATFFTANPEAGIDVALLALPLARTGLSPALAKRIKAEWRGWQIYFSLSRPLQREQVTAFLAANEIEADAVTIIEADWVEGIELPEFKFVLLTPFECFQREGRFDSPHHNFPKALTISSYEELLPGDYVVHDTYGVGQFVGIEQRTIDQICQDYLIIDYASSDRLLVPLDQYHLVRKYVSSDGVTPRLNQLSRNDWARTKARVKRRINDLASHLVTLYQKRSTAIGVAYSPDNELQTEFEAQFPHPLTSDQKTALAAIKKDLEAPFPMDRLLCGDVGFGKTEVALRAAFKVMLDDRQVLFLCPTTFLARQHYEVATQRLAGTGLKVVLLSRLVSSSELKTAQAAISDGSAQLIIATHKGLSKDYTYPNLGLIIIDEEHRFGVKDKEKVQLLKAEVDVLALTATPIPRTMQMSLMEVRGLSEINTPPLERFPVQTMLMEKSAFLLKTIITRELARGGQVFYLYNRIASLPMVASQLARLLPTARIGIAHGQLAPSVNEKTLAQFYQGEIDVLIATTIIEAGLDIPNANTMIIDGAERLGLAQLYQLRGRVGRSSRLGYCYLLYQARHQLSEKAQKRLDAIKEFTALGSGYRIALRDLALRGAGDLLGPDQSGFIDVVGIELYLRLLQEAMQEKLNGSVPAAPKRGVKVQVSAYIPDRYAGSLGNKFALYRKIIDAPDLNALDQLNEEIKDLHGRIQAPAFLLLLDKRRFELLSEHPLVLAVNDFKQGLSVTLDLAVSPYEYNVLDDFCGGQEPPVTLTVRAGELTLKVKKGDFDWLESINASLIFIFAKYGKMTL